MARGRHPSTWWNNADTWHTLKAQQQPDPSTANDLHNRHHCPATSTAKFDLSWPTASRRLAPAKMRKVVRRMFSIWGGAVRFSGLPGWADENEICLAVEAKAPKQSSSICCAPDAPISILTSLAWGEQSSIFCGRVRLAKGHAAEWVNR